MHRPDSQELNAIARISKSTDGEVLIKYLQTELDTLMATLLDSSDANTPRVQGMGKECQNILGLLREAPKMAEKLRKA
jgi:hypothetical protein